MDVQIKRLDDPNFKGAVAINLDDVIIMNKKTFPTHIIEICKEIIFVHRVAIYFQKNSHLVDQIDDVIAALQTNGLIGHWEKNVFDVKYTTNPPPNKEARNLGISHLIGSFRIFLLGLLVAFIVFTLECLSSKIKLMHHILIWFHRAR